MYRKLFTVAFLIAVCARLSFAAEQTDEEEPGPDIVVIAEGTSSQTDLLPSVRILKEKLWGKYFPMISMRFPNVPGYQSDAWCYEAALDFVDAKAGENGVGHRQNPQGGVFDQSAMLIP